MLNTHVIKQARKLKFNCKSPYLFSIPLDVYADEVKRERDKELFLKIQELRKNCDQLRQKLHYYSTRHLERIKLTKELVSQTRAFNKSLLSRRN